MQLDRSTRALAMIPMLVITAGLAACASGGGGGDGTPRRSGNTITAEELVDYTTFTALDVIRRLRPRWLQPRGTTATGANLPVAFLDGARLGDPSRLSSINVSDIESIRYLSASDATMRYGTNFPGGAIEVRTRSR